MEGSQKVHHRVLENPRLLRLEDEEQALEILAEDSYEDTVNTTSCVSSPAVRSLSMSRNMAASLVDEVSHMIRHPPRSSPSPTPKKTAKKPSDTSLSEYQPPPSLPSISLSNPETEVKSLLLSSGVSLVETKKGRFTSPSLGTSPSSCTSILSGICVSKWDDIVGPTTVYLWTEQLTSLFYPVDLPGSISNMVKYITDHTVDHHRLTGEDPVPASSQRSIFVVVPALNLVYLSLSFRVPPPVDHNSVLEFHASANMTGDHPNHPPPYIPHALSVLAPLTSLNVFLLLRPLLMSWLSEFAPKTGVLLAKNKLQNSMMNSWCAELCKTVGALQSCWIKEKHEEKEEDESARAERIRIENLVKEVKKATKRTMSRTVSESPHESDFLPPNIKRVPKSAWAGIVSSHLMTGGASLVVGADNVAVNQLIRFLLCFAASPDEGYCSRYSLPSLPDTFMKGLLIQGLTTGGIGERSISFNQITSSKFPLTHIELDPKLKVRQVNPMTHSQTRKFLLAQELNALWTSSAFASAPNDPFGGPAKQELPPAAGFIKELMEDLTILPPQRRFGRMMLFRRALHFKVMNLVTYLHSILHLPVKERQRLIKLIPSVFGWDEVEFTIIKIAAEKLKPGIMKKL